MQHPISKCLESALVVLPECVVCACVCVRACACRRVGGLECWRAVPDRAASEPWGPQFCGVLCKGVTERLPARGLAPEANAYSQQLLKIGWKSGIFVGVYIHNSDLISETFFTNVTTNTWLLWATTYWRPNFATAKGTAADMLSKL